MNAGAGPARPVVRCRAPAAPAAGGDTVSLATVIRYTIPALLVITATYLAYLVLSENKKTERINKKYYE